MKKVAVVGFGFMGKTHCLNILKDKNLELVAIVDKDEKAIERGFDSVNGNFSTGMVDRENLDKVDKYTSFDNCLQTEKPDAVHICVHTDQHYLMAKKALDAGSHVLIEKPFCLNVKQGKELISLAKAKGLVLMVAHVVRFMPPYQQLKEWIDTGKYGQLKFLSLSRFTGIPQWGQWKEKQTDFGTSGGALFDLVIHDIDFTLNIFGKPEKINSQILPGVLSNHDYVITNWEYDQGIRIKIEGGNTFHAQFPFQVGFMARCEEASINYTTWNPDVIQVSNDIKTEAIPVGELCEGYASEIAYFARCIETNSPPVDCTPESSLEAVKVCFEHLVS